MKDEIDLKGISTFFYFAIPSVLALAALWWLAFGEGLHLSPDAFTRGVLTICFSAIVAFVVMKQA